MVTPIPNFSRLTTTLYQMYDVFPDFLGYGIPLSEVQELTHVLTSVESGKELTGKYGTFAVYRTKQWDADQSSYVHGIRVAAVDENMELLSAVVKANQKLATFDTTNEEAVWASKPFWSN